MTQGVPVSKPAASVTRRQRRSHETASGELAAAALDARRQLADAIGTAARRPTAS